MGQSEGILEREVHSNTYLPKIDIFQIYNLTLNIQVLEEEKQT